MRTVIGKAIILGLVVATASITACSSTNTKSEQSELGEVGLRLTLPDGSTINTVNYSITGPGGYTRTGEINVSDSQNIRALVTGIPAGTGYSVVLSATTSDGRSCTSAPASFDIIAGQTSAVSVRLNCLAPAPTTGELAINGELNICPVLDSVVVEPVSVIVGNVIALSATANDSDSFPAAVGYAWAIAGSQIATGASASYTCATAGTYVIDLTVSDGEAACNVVDSVTVTCEPDPSGETGGTTDPGTGGTTDPGTGGTTDPGTGGTDAGGTGGTLGADLSVVQAARGDSCVQCAVSYCDPNVDDGLYSILLVAGSNTAGVSRVELGLDVLECVLTSGCASSGSGTACYCGTQDTEYCLAGYGDGVCKAAEEAGLETRLPTRIANYFGDTSLGGGRANLLVQCLNDNRLTHPECDACFNARP